MDLEHQTDEQLMHEFQTGNEEAITMLFYRHKNGVFHFALRMLNNRAEAEDVVSDGFLILCQKKESYRPSPEAKFTTWFYTVIRNQCINRLRKQGRKFSLWFKTEKGEVKEFDVPDEQDGVDEVLHQKEVSVVMQQVISQMPVEQREALILREFQQFSYAEIAEILGCSLDKVKILIYRARQYLFDNLPSFIKEGQS